MALDDLWSLDQKLKKSNLHTSQIAGPSKHDLSLFFKYSSDSTVEEERKEPTDYDTIHPSSPKISKGGTIKKSKVQKLKKTMSKKHDESLIDVHTSTSAIDPKITSTSVGQEDSTCDSDGPPSAGIAHRKEKSNNEDELSSDVAIAPSGIVRKENNYFQHEIINSESDEGNCGVKQNYDVDIVNTGK